MAPVRSAASLKESHTPADINPFQSAGWSRELFPPPVWWIALLAMMADGSLCWPWMEPGQGPLAIHQVIGGHPPLIFLHVFLPFMCGDKPGYHVSQCVKLTFFVYDEPIMNAEERPTILLHWRKCFAHRMEMGQKEREKTAVMKTKDSKLHQLTAKIIHYRRVCCR